MSLESPTFAKKGWMLHNPEKTFSEVVDKIRNEAGLLSGHYVSAFSKHMMAILVYTSNKLESTLPAGISEKEACRILDEIYLEGNQKNFWDVPTETWSADGDVKGNNVRPQFLQHMRAARYLLEHIDMPLTVDAVLKTHQLLMNGATDDDGNPIMAGKFRDHACHAGHHTFPIGDQNMLHTALTKIVEAFNRSMAELHVSTLITAPVRLMYETITLHPFQNGNGRLCRLLFAFAVRKAGVPFPVPFTTGHSKARSHYVRAILRARRGDMGELHSMALMSINATLHDFEVHVRLTEMQCQIQHFLT